MSAARRWAFWCGVLALLGCGRLRYETKEVAESSDVSEPGDVSGPGDAPAPTTPFWPWTPSNLDLAQLPQETGELVVGTFGDAVLDTDSGKLTILSSGTEVALPAGVSWSVQPQVAPAPELGILVLRRLVLPGGCAGISRAVERWWCWLRRTS